MKHLLFFLLLISTTLHSQTRYPFGSKHKNIKTITLTNGKYDEFFDEDTLQRVGSSVININTRKITKIKLSQEEIDELENAQATRWLSVDPQFSRGPEYSPYTQSFNNPLNVVDEKGEWGVLAHYRMIKRALIKLGITKKTAEEIAYYGSTYADGAHGFVLFLNQALGIFGGTPPQKLAIKDKTLSESQSDQSVQMVSIHAMKTSFENITNEEAVNRALNGGTFKDKDGKTVVIEGALNVIEKFKGRDIEKLSDDEKKELGVAFHTIGDAIAHMGKRWVNSSIGRKDAKEKGYKNEHDFFNDLLNFKGIKESQNKIEKAIETIQNKDEKTDKTVENTTPKS
jgi:hypothetical protein